MESESKNSITVKLPPWPEESKDWNLEESDKWLEEKVEEALDLHFPEWREGILYLADFQLEGVKTWNYGGD